MSDDTKDLLAFSGLMALMPIVFVSYLGMTAFISILYFSWMDTLEALLVSSVVAGITNAACFFIIMKIGSFVANLFQKFKEGEK